MTTKTTFRVKGTDVFIRECSTIERGIFCLEKFGHKVSSEELEVFHGKTMLDFPVHSHIFTCF